MKKRFSYEQIISILREAEAGVSDVSVVKTFAVMRAQARCSLVSATVI